MKEVFLGNFRLGLIHPFPETPHRPEFLEFRERMHTFLREKVDPVEIDATGDRLHFDESCFIRQQPGAGRFQLDNLAPVAGIGVVGGAADTELREPVTTLEALQKRVRFSG